MTLSDSYLRVTVIPYRELPTARCMFAAESDLKPGNLQCQKVYVLMLGILIATPRNDGHDACEQVSCQSVKVLGHQAIAARALVRCNTRSSAATPFSKALREGSRETMHPKP